MSSHPTIRRTRAAAAGSLACLLACAGAQAGPVGYSLTGTTRYTAGCGTGTASVGTCGGPDTGWLSITNTGASAFVGSGRLFGVAPSQTIDLTVVGALNPGESWVFNAGPESSNQGGFNKQGGALPDLGLTFLLNGIIDGGALVVSINDADIHSGVTRTNPFGVDVDSDVLQGGDPFGRDTGDNFEESQAVGRFVFSARPDGTVPEPTSIGLALAALAAMGAVRRRQRG